MKFFFVKHFFTICIYVFSINNKNCYSIEFTMKSIMKNKRICLILVLLGLVLVIVFYCDYKNSLVNNEQAIKPAKNAKHHVFIDLGANVGDSVKYFFSHGLNPFSKSVMQGFGLIDEKEWVIHAVEPNPSFNSYMDDLKVLYEHMGHKVVLYKQTAAWIQNGKLDFYIDISKPGNKQVGSSLIRNHPNVIKSNFTKIKVTAIDLSELLNKYTIEDEIILKMDVEGAEYKLLDYLIKKDCLKLIDVIAVEFHDYLENESQFKNPQEYFKKQFKLNNIRFVNWD